MPVKDIFPNDVRQSLPALHSQEGIRDPIIHLKFFTRDADWSWYVTEGSPEHDDFIFFGFVVGVEEEWGHFSLSELTAACGPSGFPIERDLYFEPDCFSRTMAKEHRQKKPLGD